MSAFTFTFLLSAACWLFLSCVAVREAAVAAVASGEEPDGSLRRAAARLATAAVGSAVAVSAAGLAADEGRLPFGLEGTGALLVWLGVLAVAAAAGTFGTARFTQAALRVLPALRANLAFQVLAVLVGMGLLVSWSEVLLALAEASPGPLGRVFGALLVVLWGAVLVVVPFRWVSRRARQLAPEVGPVGADGLREESPARRVRQLVLIASASAVVVFLSGMTAVVAGPAWSMFAAAAAMSTITTVSCYRMARPLVIDPVAAASLRGFFVWLFAAVGLGLGGTVVGLVTVLVG